MKKQPRGRTTFSMVRQAALALPNVEEGTAWGFPAFRIKKKMFACFREDLDSIVVLVPMEVRDEMMAADPETYYTTDHHRPYPCVLARIPKLRPDAVPDLLRMAWQYMAPKAKRKYSG